MEAKLEAAILALYNMTPQRRIRSASRNLEDARHALANINDAIKEACHAYDQRFYVKGRGLTGPIDAEMLRLNALLSQRGEAK